MIRVTLPWPSPLLWPNGSRGHHHAVARAKAKYREWAHIATLEALRGQRPLPTLSNPIPVKIIVHAKPKGPLPDRDNVVAASKAGIDGIAAQLGINDRHFASPVVEFASPRDGHFIIEIGSMGEGK